MEQGGRGVTYVVRSTEVSIGDTMSRMSGTAPAPAAARYQALLDVAESIASHQQVSTLLVHLGQALRRILEFTGMSMTLYDAEAQTLQILAFNTPFESPVPVGFTIPVDQTPAS